MISGCIFHFEIHVIIAWNTNIIYLVINKDYV